MAVSMDVELGGYQEAPPVRDYVAAYYKDGQVVLIERQTTLSGITSDLFNQGIVPRVGGKFARGYIGDDGTPYVEGNNPTPRTHTTERLQQG